MIIAILGGTGKEGFGLGYRWAHAGHEIIIGSRSAERAAAKAAELQALLPEDRVVTGRQNLAAAEAGELVVLSVPYEAQAPTLEQVKPALQGKLLLTVVVPLRKPKSRVWLPAAGSAAMEAHALLGPDVPIVAAFHSVSAEHLLDLDHDVDCDVLVCGDRETDREVALQLASQAGMQGVEAGPLVNAGVVEGLAAVLIYINIRHKIKNAGIRITGIPPAS